MGGLGYTDEARVSRFWRVSVVNVSAAVQTKL